MGLMRLTGGLSHSELRAFKHKAEQKNTKWRGTTYCHILVIQDPPSK